MSIFAESWLLPLCNHYAIGKPQSLQKVPGGLLHPLWQLTTTQGIYAVKCLNPVSTQLLAHNILAPQKSQEVAAYMLAKGIPTIASLQQDGQYSFSYENLIFEVMPWIEGEVLQLDELSLNSIEKIGNLLGKIHCANYPITNFKKPNWVGLNPNEWQQLLDSLKGHKQVAEIIDYELPNLINWSKQAKSVQNTLNKALIVSHRDLTRHNVLWQHNSPILIDWEYAGLLNPVLDVLIVACNWSGVLSGKWDIKKFNGILTGFKDETESDINFNEHTLSGYIGYCLDWFIFNARKAATDPLSASNEMMRTLRAVHLVSKHAIKYCRLGSNAQQI